MTRALLVLLCVLALPLSLAPGAATAAPGPAGRTPGQVSAEREATELRHVHGSSLWTADPAAVERDLDRWMSRADVVTMTESAGTRARQRTLREPGWSSLYYSGAGRRFPGAWADSSIMWRDTAWRALARTSAPITKRTFAARARDRRGTAGRATTALLENVHTGATLLVTVVHMPSLVEAFDGNGFSKERGLRQRVSVYRDAIVGYRRHVAAWTSQYAPDSRMVVADWNIDLKRPWARRYLRKQWASTGLVSAWRAPFGAKGTYVSRRGRVLRHRWIDGTLVDRGTSFVSTPRSLGRVRSSDHLPYREVLRLPQ